MVGARGKAARSPPNWLAPSSGKVVAASFLALAVSGSPILIYTQGIFLGPMTHAFGWSRGAYFLPLSIGGIAGAVATFLVGGFSDRQGVRPWLLGGVAAFGLLNLGLAFVPGSIWLYSLLIIGLILAAAPHGPLLYTKAISEWALARPGQAIAIALAGTAVGGVLTPPLCVGLIHVYGWRVARAVLSVPILLVALPAVWAAIRPPPPEKRAHVVELDTHLADVSLSLAEALRTRRYLQLLVGVFAAAAALNGVLTNLTPLVTDHGVSPATAGAALSAFAVAQICGRLAAGALLDRVKNSRVGAAFLLIALPGLLSLAEGTSAAPVIGGAALLGLALGSELQLGAYFVLRFFGLKHYGAIYGLLMSVFTVGSTLGPLVMGVAFDRTHDNALGLWLCAGAILSAIACLATLGRYRFAAPGLSTSPGNGSDGPAASAVNH